MAFQTAREWHGIQQFPPVTRTRLIELLGKLKHQNVSTLTILLMGKGGVGKSSTVNSIKESGLPPSVLSRTRAELTLNIIDTPGIVEGGYVSEQVVGTIKRFLLNKTIDVLLYVDRLDTYRMDNLDKQVVKAITETFGKKIWRRGLVVLSHAQLCPPDGLQYDDFVARRSETLLKYIRQGAGISKQDFQKNVIPVVLVENSGRCKVNNDGEKILPNGIPWIPNLLEAITNVIAGGGQSITVDQKLIEGPNPNSRGKVFIPLILGLQYLLVKQVQRAIREDIRNESKPISQLRDTGLTD